MMFEYTKSLLQKQIDFNEFCLKNISENQRAVKSRIKDNKELQSAIEILQREGKIKEEAEEMAERCMKIIKENEVNNEK